MRETSRRQSRLQQMYALPTNTRRERAHAPSDPSSHNSRKISPLPPFLSHSASSEARKAHEKDGEALEFRVRAVHSEEGKRSRKSLKVRMRKQKRCRGQEEEKRGSSWLVSSLYSPHITDTSMNIKREGKGEQNVKANEKKEPKTERKRGGGCT